MLSLDLIAFLTFAVLFGGYHYISGYRSLVDRSIGVSAVALHRDHDRRDTDRRRQQSRRLR